MTLLAIALDSIIDALTKTLQLPKPFQGELTRAVIVPKPQSQLTRNRTS